MRRTYFVILMFVVALLGCKKEEPVTESIDFGYEYFPLTVGDSAFYNVQYIFWNDFDQTIDTSNYLLCEFTESISQNYSGDSLYRIERLLKADLSETWRLDSVWYALKTKSEGLRVENNKTFSKIVFPINLKSSWNANAYNNLGEKMSKCVSFSSPMVNNVAYNNAVSIDLERFASLINSDIETEIYGYNKGLVEKTKVHVYHPFNPVSGSFDIKSGYKYSQKRY